MLFELPHSHTTVLRGQLELDAFATHLIIGHISATARPDVLILGNNPLTDLKDNALYRHITFIQEQDMPIDSRRYSLIVVNYPVQTTVNNELIQIEVSQEQHTVLQRLAFVGIPFLAIVS